MKTRAQKERSLRQKLVVITGTDFDPPESEAVLYRVGLLTEPRGELKKTGREDRAIEKTIACLNDIRRELELAPVQFDPAHIHVQGECAFAQQWANVGQAFMKYGHVYLPRYILFVYSLQYLTHELTHLASFRAVIDPTLGEERATLFMRSGFSTLVSDEPLLRRLFTDFNEAVTEIIATEIRRRIITETDLITPPLSDGLLHEHPCPAQVRLVRELIEIVGCRLGKDEARRLLFTDYFEQTDRFLAELAKIDEQVVGRLETMDTNADALAIAQDLGLDDAVADIKRIRLRRRRR